MLQRARKAREARVASMGPEGGGERHRDCGTPFSPDTREGGSNVRLMQEER